MTELEDKLRLEIGRLLDEKIVDVVFGFRKADSPLHPQPAFFTNPAELDELVYNGLCQNNLAAFLPRYGLETKIGMVVRGCENRSVNALVVEHQHARENLYLIGVPCHGIVDWRKLVEAADEDISGFNETDAEVTLEIKGKTLHFERNAMLHDSCLRCIHPNPLNANLTLGELLPEGNPALARAEVESFDKLDLKARNDWFQHESERCIRCYACREACPMCYCIECFVDHTSPRWTETSTTPAGMQGWHIVRAFHQTGRCVSCGACERACPMDIRMTYLTEKLNEDMRREYHFETGMDIKTQPPFAAFTLDDKARFTI